MGEQDMDTKRTLNLFQQNLTNAFKFQDKWKLSQLQMIFQWRTYNHKYSDSQMDFFGKCVPFHWQIPLVPVKFNAKKHKCKEELREHKAWSCK